MSLKLFLKRYQQISVIDESEVISPFYHEIRLRALDQDFWLKCVEKLTKAFPDICISKRYLYTNQKFGYNWSIILFGPREPEQLQQFCEEADFVIATHVISSKQEESQPTGNDQQFFISKKNIYNKKGEKVGDVTRVKLPGTGDTLNNFSGTETPRVFSGNSIEAEKEVSRLLKR